MNSVCRCIVLAALALVVLAPAAAWSADRAVVLRGLDKITARITTFDAPIDMTVPFGTLRITPRVCNKRPPEETPEVAAFLEIFDQRPGETQQIPLFSGWMFASSPALSALEHPVYDVWVIDCRTSSADSEAPPQEKSAN